MISEAESLNVWESENFYIVQDRFGLDETLIQELNLKRNTEIFNYTSEIAELISDEELLKQIDI